MCEIHSNNELGQNVNETVLLEESRKNNVEIIFNSCFKINNCMGWTQALLTNQIYLFLNSMKKCDFCKRGRERERQ